MLFVIHSFNADADIIFIGFFFFTFCLWNNHMNEIIIISGIIFQKIQNGKELNGGPLSHYH